MTTNTKRSFFFWVPNTITAMNLACGSIAVFLGVQGYIQWAACFIAAASIFDFLDGMAARALNSYSDVGKELDSLCDLVSFGLAPASIVFTLLQLSLFGKLTPILEMDANWYEWIILASCLLIPIAGAFRLAKFNLDTRQTSGFLGLPIPANALFFSALGLVYASSNDPFAQGVILNTFNLIASILIFSTLMITEIPMFSLKIKNLSWADNQVRYIFLGICIILVGTLGYIGLPLILISYIVLSILTRNWA